MGPKGQMDPRGKSDLGNLDPSSCSPDPLKNRRVKVAEPWDPFPSGRDPSFTAAS